MKYRLNGEVSRAGRRGSAERWGRPSWQLCQGRQRPVAPSAGHIVSCQARSSASHIGRPQFSPSERSDVSAGLMISCANSRSNRAVRLWGGKSADTPRRGVRRHARGHRRHLGRFGQICPCPQSPCGRCATSSTGTATYGSELPAKACCLPRLRTDPFTGLGCGLLFRGRSSEEGGIKEFRLLRPRSVPTP